MKFLLCLVGMVFIIEGLPYFAFPSKMKKWMSAIQELPDPYLRVFGFLAMCLGLFMTYMFKE